MAAWSDATIPFGVITDSAKFFEVAPSPNEPYEGIVGLAYVALAEVSDTSRRMAGVDSSSSHFTGRTHPLLRLLLRCSS